MTAYTKHTCVDALNSGRFEVNRHSAQSNGLAYWWPLGEDQGVSPAILDFAIRDYGGRYHWMRPETTNNLSRKLSFIPQLGMTEVFDFDGTNDAVRNELTLDSDTVHHNFCFSVTARVYGETLDNYRGIVLHGSTDANSFFQWYVTTDSGGVPKQRMRWNGTTIATSTTQLSTDTWYSVGFSRNWNGSSSTVTFYVDGQADGTGSSSQGAKEGFWQIFIGKSLFASEYWDGMIKDVRIYNWCVPDALMQQIHFEPWRLVRPIGADVFAKVPDVTAGFPFQYYYQSQGAAL